MILYSPQTKMASGPGDPTAPTFFLDLDLCSLYGNDTFDLLNLAQTQEMSDTFNLCFTFKLLNPSMLRAMQKLVIKHPNARVCIYTRKGDMLSNGGVPTGMIKYSEAFVPSSMTPENYLKLGVAQEMHNSVMRLFLAREAIQGALGHPLDMIISDCRKSVRRACINVLRPSTNPDIAFLWDDNRAIKGDYHVLTVPEYNAIPPILADMVNDDLEFMFPGRKILDTNIILFLSSAPTNSSSYNPKTNTVFVRVAQEPLPEWPVPDIPLIDKATADMLSFYGICTVSRSFSC
jgi:hypothetical protein